MKKFYLLISLALITLFVPNIFAQQVEEPPPPAPAPAVEYNERAWKTFTSQEGGFTVLMPGQPVKSGSLLKSETSTGPLAYYLYNLKTSMAEYVVSYTDFEFVMNDPTILKVAYDGGRDNLLAKNSLKLIEDKDVYINGHLGRQIVAEGKDYIFHDRMVAVNKRFYQAMIVTRNYRTGQPSISKFYETVVNKFLSSLKLMNIDAVTTKAPLGKSEDVASVDLGRVENNVYLNSYFKFRLSLPADWHVQERETGEAVLNVGRELVKGSNEQANTALDQSISRTLILFTLSKFPLSAPTGTQAVLQCGAEKITDPRITSAVYMEMNKKFLLASPMRYRLLRDGYTETIGGVSFSVYELEQPREGSPSVKQKYYGASRKGFILFFVATYIDQQDRTKMEKMLSTMKFE